MAAFVEVGSNLRPLQMTATQSAFHHQDVRTPATMASESQDASLDHLLAHLESSKQALEHQVQQLLQENQLSKSAKKEQQWHMEGERLHLKLDSLNLALMEREERNRQLEKELRDSRDSIQQVQSRCRETEKEKERGNLERANLQADLEDAQSNFQNLEREYKLKLDVAEKQQRALESLSDKVEKQRVSFQNQLEDARRELVELEEREQKYQLAAQLSSQHLAEKGRQLKSLRDAHEKLLAIQKRKQADERREVKEVVILLESSHAKCEEQKALIQELEGELGRIKKQAYELDARIAAVEADASSKSSMLEKVQQELNNTSSKAVTLAKSKAQTEDLETQVQTLKRNLQDVENMLSDESALRFKAECALNEYKVREKTFLKVEQELQEDVKWRNEQFESLEEAHNKMRDQFHEGLSMWASERAAILHDIEVLTENVQSRDFVIHDLRSQVKLLQQSLAHEENCRKLLEFQLTDAKAGYESVSAEYFGAQCILESLRENSKKELAFLKDTLAERDSQLKELHVKKLQIDRDQKKMMHLEAELDSYKSRCERLQQALEKGNGEVMETGVPLDSKHRDSLTRSLTDAEAIVAKKEVEMKELEIELDRTRTLSELLRTSLLEAEERRLEGNSDAVQTIEKLSTALSAKEQHAIDLEMEVERLQVVVNDVRKCNAEAEQRIRALEDRLRDAHKELQARSCLSHSVLNIQEHEDVVHAMRSECQTLQRQLSTCDFEKFEIEKHRDKLLAEQKQQYQEKQELVSKLERLGKQFTLKNVRVNDLLDQIEKEKHVIRTLETRCSGLEQDLSKQLLLAEEIRKELIVEKRVGQEHQERNQALDAALSANIAAKDASLKVFKDTVDELTVLCKGGSATSQTQLRISSIEEKLKNQDVLGGQLVSLLGEVEQVAQGVGNLNIELNSLKDDSKLTKSEFETRLNAVEGVFSSSFAELQEISEQVGKMNAERMSLVDVLNKKEGALELLNRENNNLNIEKHKLVSNADVLEERLHHLVKEAESKKAIIVNLNVNMKAAEEGVATLHDFHGKLEESENKNMKLVNVADQVIGLQRKLIAMEEIVHDKEQRLAASEWTMQQLASEIAKSKSCLAQKEKDETTSGDLVEHSEAELKVKERELMVLQCDLKNAVKTSNDNVALVQQLTVSKGERGHVLELTKRALEEKAATLTNSEAEIKRLRETQRLTEEALESCKEQLSNELTTNLAQEQDMKHLCEDIERANHEASLVDVDVKNLQASLKCLERTTETRMESCERKLQEGASDLAEYQEKCASLLTLIDKKDSRVQQLEFEVTHGEKELEGQVMLAEQGQQELRFVSEQLQSKTKILTSLKVELATMDNLVRESDTQKQRLEEEVRGLKVSLSVASRDLKQKAMEIEDQVRIVNQLKSAFSHQGDAHSKELQMVTSNAAEETESNVSKLQAALNGARDELGELQKMLSINEGEKRVLSLRLSELESLVEKGKSQVSHLQADLQFARANLDAETERVWHQVSARNEIEIELDGWKWKTAALTESQAEFESEISRLQGEINDWKEVTEHTKTLSQEELEAWELKVASQDATIEKLQVEVMEWKAVAERTMLQSAELEKSMRAVQESVVGWENMITSLADDGDIAKLQLELVLKQVHDEFRTLHGELANTKEVIFVTRQEGHTLKAEFQDCVNSLQAEVEVWKGKVAVATEDGLQMKYQFEDLIKNLQRELKNWKQFEVLALGDDSGAQTVANDTVLGTGMEESCDICDIALNPFYQEDEGCSSAQDNDNSTASQLDGWKTKSLAEGRKLAHQLRASLKHLQFELESRKQAPKEAKHDFLVHRRDDTGLENLVKALQEEAVEIKAELAVWKNKAHEIGILKDDLERAIDKLNAEVEVWKDRSAMSAGQRIVARRQLDDLAKQVKSLTGELQKWKDVATEANEGATKLQSEVERWQKESQEVRGETNEWMQKALELNCVSKDLEEKLKQSGVELEHLRAEGEKWRTVAMKAEDEGKVTKMELLDTLGKFEDELEVMSGNSIGGCSTTGDTSFKEEDPDCSLQSSSRISNEWRHELEISLQAEIEDWKKKVVEEEDLRQAYETTIKELRMEVDELKKSAAFIAEDRRCEIVALEKKMKDLEAKDHFAEVQGELQIWKERTADATEEGTHLRDTYENVIQELQIELAQWKAKSETATDECQSVREDLENVVHDLQSQAQVWKLKAEKALENVVKTQEYEDLIKALEEELCLWMQQTQESKLLQLQLENEQVLLKESLVETQNELQKWKDKISAITSASIQSLRGLATISEEDDKVNIYPLHDEDEDEFNIDHAIESQQLQDWKSRAEQAELLQLQLEDVLAETQIELHEWKQKTADFSLAAEFLKEELESLVEEGRLEKEELIRSNGELEAWRQRAQEKAEHLQTLQVQLTCSLASSSEELQRWKQKAMEMESNLDLRNLVSQWKEKAQEGEFLHRQTKESLTETHIEIKELKDQIIVLNLFTDSLKDELKSANEFVSTLTTQLSTQKQNEESFLKLNQQLEADLVLAREEASSRKHKMTQLLSQLEGNRESQMELQTKLHLAQRRLLGIEKVHSQTKNVNRGIGETAAAKANFSEPDDKMNPAVGKMRQELFSLKSLVSKLEHVRGNDGEQSQASSNVVGDDELAFAEEISIPRAASLPSRLEVVLQKQFESCKAVEEVAHPQMKKGIDGPTRARAHSLARFKVLADVNGNSPRASADHDIKLHR